MIVRCFLHSSPSLQDEALNGVGEESHNQHLHEEESSLHLAVFVVQQPRLRNVVLRVLTFSRKHLPDGVWFGYIYHFHAKHFFLEHTAKFPVSRSDKCVILLYASSCEQIQDSSYQRITGRSRYFLISLYQGRLWDELLRGKATRSPCQSFATHRLGTPALEVGLKSISIFISIVTNEKNEIGEGKSSEATQEITKEQSDNSKQETEKNEMSSPSQQKQKEIEVASDSDEEFSSLDAAIKADVQELQKESEKKHRHLRRFGQVATGAKNYVFIRSTLEDPLPLSLAIMDDILKLQRQKTKKLIRMIPVQATCKSFQDDIVKAVKNLCESYFREKGESFYIAIKVRNNSSIERESLKASLITVRHHIVRHIRTQCTNLHPRGHSRRDIVEVSQTGGVRGDHVSGVPTASPAHRKDTRTIDSMDPVVLKYTNMINDMRNESSRVERVHETHFGSIRFDEENIPHLHGLFDQDCKPEPSIDPAQHNTSTSHGSGQGELLADGVDSFTGGSEEVKMNDGDPRDRNYLDDCMFGDYISSTSRISKSSPVEHKQGASRTNSKISDATSNDLSYIDEVFFKNSLENLEINRQPAPDYSNIKVDIEKAVLSEEKHVTSEKSEIILKHSPENVQQKHHNDKDTMRQRSNTAENSEAPRSAYEYAVRMRREEHKRQQGLDQEPGDGSNKSYRKILSLLNDKTKEKYTRYEVLKSLKSSILYNDSVIDIPVGEGIVDGYRRMVLKPDVKELKSTTSESKLAITRFKVISKKDSAALVELSPMTGVKHQLRVHLGFGLSCPILGDHKYSHVKKMAPQKSSRREFQSLPEEGMNDCEY
ncbi:RNA pseudouridylate synthase domain-containing protein 4 [Portunus trituberculatus]|uniref:RNA pseudouridylate synthase domain-containing protein 4 n=1 Tax=Portunus trituberculatus TaxID=210409 RepID=A0A5B7D1V8_PORTR|nr:RNA pseudouridylate synthase domain-containing protein 4 [Portunus trituberculatus]